MTDTPTMSLVDALGVLTQAAYAYTGTRQDHMLIEQAAQLLTAHLSPSNGQTASRPQRRAKP